jgi:hypothetical protein
MGRTASNCSIGKKDVEINAVYCKKEVLARQAMYV